MPGQSPKSSNATAQCAAGDPSDGTTEIKELAEAYISGAAAYDRGAIAIPALDEAYRAMLPSCFVRENGARAVAATAGAWLKGWHERNLATRGR
ncbi:MAG: hypothetical protein ACR2M1_05260 [Gemmatimonadaceae bacterium]